MIAKLSFTSAIGSSLSQSKWLWYRQDRFRPLQDIQLFDDASRGPWGALALIFHVRTRYALNHYLFICNVPLTAGRDIWYQLVLQSQCYCCSLILFFSKLWCIPTGWYLQISKPLSSALSNMKPGAVRGCRCLQSSTCL